MRELQLTLMKEVLMLPFARARFSLPGVPFSEFDRHRQRQSQNPESRALPPPRREQGISDTLVEKEVVRGMEVDGWVG